MCVLGVFWSHLAGLRIISRFGFASRTPARAQVKKCPVYCTTGAPGHGDLEKFRVWAEAQPQVSVHSTQAGAQGTMTAGTEA